MAYFLLSVTEEYQDGTPFSKEVGIVVSESPTAVLQKLKLAESSKMTISSEYREDLIMFCTDEKGNRFKLESFSEIDKLPVCLP